MSSQSILLLLFVIFYNNAIIDAINLGDSCSSDFECAYIINAECRNSVCECNAATIRHENACVQRVEPIRECSSSEECKSPPDWYRMCTEGGVCACVPYYNWNGESCRKNRGLYEYCSSDADCYWGENMANLMTCTRNRCSCVPGYLPRGKLCIAVNNTPN